MSDMESKKLFGKMMRLQWLLHRQHFRDHAGNGPFTDPTRGQGRVLAILKMQPEISTKDLSYLLNIRQQSLSELLGKLEKAGCITRTPLESDKRVMMVRLTDKGKSAQQKEPDAIDLFDCFTPEEQAVFESFLDRIIAGAEAALGVDDGEDMEEWMKQARSRMGDEAFEYLMEMRGKGIPMFADRRFGGMRGHDFNRHRHGKPDDPRW